MAVQLIINDKLIELGEKPIALTYAINNFAEVKDRQANFSNKFKVPKTQPNLDALDIPNEVASGTNTPYLRNNAKIIQNGVEIVPIGLAIIDASKADLEITVYSGNTSFFDLIEGLKLSDLDLSDLDHNWNITNIINSNNNTSGYIYPVVHYGGEKLRRKSRGGFTTELNTRDIDVRLLLPAVFVHTLFTKIAEGVGYTFAGAILGKPSFRNLILPFSAQARTLEGTELANRAFLATMNAGQVLTVPYFTKPNSGNLIVEFNNDSTSPAFDNGGNYDTSSFSWKPLIMVSSEVTATVKYNVQVRNLESFDVFEQSQGLVKENNLLRLDFTIELNGSPISFFTREYFGANDFGDIPLPDVPASSQVLMDNDTALIEVPSRSFVPGDEVKVRVALSGQALYTDAGVSTLADMEIIVTVAPGATLTQFFNGPTTTVQQFGTDIKMSELMPDMTQKAFMLNIMRQFFLSPQTDPVGQTVQFRQLEEIYDNIAIAEDWSDKIDETTDDQITFRLPGYAQKNELKYQQDEELVNLGLGELGNGSFIVNDKTLPTQKTLFTLDFGATRMEKRLKGLDVPVIIKIEEQQFKVDTSPRILLLDRQNITGGDITYSDGTNSIVTSTDIPLCYFILPGKDVNLGFDDNLILSNYSELLFILDKTKILTKRFDLDQVDISKLDHFIPVYVKKYGNYFYINVISNYIDGDTTACSLVRL